MKFVLISILLLVAELLYFYLADKLNIIDKPNLRSSHTNITLRGGGIVFPISMMAYAVFFGVEYVWFLIGLLAISIVSFVDDVYTTPNKVRIVVQFSAMLLMCYQWGIITSELWWLVIPALILSTGIINAFNFLDGINGILHTSPN